VRVSPRTGEISRKQRAHKRTIGSLGGLRWPPPRPSENRNSRLKTGALRAAARDSARRVNCKSADSPAPIQTKTQTQTQSRARMQSRRRVMRKKAH